MASGRRSAVHPMATTSASYGVTAPSSAVTVLLEASHPTTLLPRRRVTPLSWYHASVWRSPPPPTHVWKPGRRAGDSAWSTALVNAGLS